MRFESLLLAGTGLTVAAAKHIVEYWDIGYLKANPDGLFERRVIGVNGQWPPPELHASINDTLTVEVRNSLDTGVTLHAHGLHNNGTNYMDGAQMVTQCAIPPGANFTYEYPVKQTGTYWIHAHSGMLYSDGLRSPLILHHREEPYKYDEEMVLTMADWYHQESSDLVKNYINWKNPGGAEPVPDSALVNSKSDGKTTLKFTPGKTYRLRLINMSSLATFHFSIEGHQLRVIEADGVDTEEKAVSNVQLAAAQRVSVLVTALNSTDGNYRFHADMDTDMFDSVPDSLVYNLTGAVQYAADAPFKQGANEWTAFDDFSLVPLEKVPPLGFDVTYSLNVIFGQFTDALNHGTFNNISFVEPSLPALLTAMTAKDPYDPAAYGHQTNTHIVQYMDDVQLVITNLDAGAHPVHLHGNFVQLIERGVAPYDPTYNPRPTAPPMRRETIMIPSMEYVILRFRADVPGVHLSHCHILYHQKTGFAMQYVVGPDEMRRVLKIPDIIEQQCRDLGHPTKGDAAEQDGPYPYPTGWTPKAKGAMAGCIISALLGFAAIVWYGWTSRETKYQPVSPGRDSEN
ncbi:ferroxidase fet3 [Coemansia sp. RSA 1290]|nr:Cupredoxin [Coemansia mojavensis]KAJ1739464.1 ferroxidase fet3 [Coemansia sp. RSA 1086]KAJ1869653.1 ferroxidase fet3 [Coemansia sp. RSA 990]KAJ2629568.1 ferroxidase fet3 [Coemansia sp. RSA 1290]KAJ2646432.1 ferroxidase fet3 [Coemansia sp. RSA 1250]KAJ2668188.1 ferroxidase fet3 [Coemansia sp. RSA 1085]